METERMPYVVRLRPEYALVYKGKLEVGRDYTLSSQSTILNYMSIMGTTVDRADKRHFDIAADSETEAIE